MEEYLEINEIMKNLYDYILFYIPSIKNYIEYIDSLSKKVLERVALYYLENDVMPFQNDDFLEMDITDKINLLIEFYKDKGVLFNPSNPFLDGAIDIECRSFDDYNENGRFKEGYNRYIDIHKSIDIYDHGILLDSVTWLHELTHYRNQRDGERSEEGKIFTEALSFTYELFYLDYLKEKGYPIEDYYLDNLDGQAGYVKYFSPIISLFYTYCRFGEISIQNFNNIYPHSNIEENEYLNYYKPNDFNFMISYVLDRYHDSCCREEFFRSSLVGIMYSFALPLQIYIYDKYKNDASYFDRVEKLVSTVNDLSFEDCMRTLNITYPFTDKFLDELELSTDKYMEQIGDYVKVLEYQKRSK